MINPFAELGKPKLTDPGEDCEGSFSCQEDGCWDVAGNAKYLEEHQILTWICKDGHISKLEGFRIG